MSGVGAAGERVKFAASALLASIKARFGGGRARSAPPIDIADLIEAFPAGVACYDPEDRLVIANQRYRSIYAESADLLVHGARFEDIIREGAQRGQYAIGPEGIEGWIADRIVKRAQVAEYEQRLATGEWLRVSDWRMRDGSILSVRVDITDLKRREASYRMMFDGNPTPMWLYDLKTFRFLEVNDAAVKHYGYSREQFLRMTIEQIRPPEEVGRLRELPQEPGLRRRGIWRHTKADGSIIYVQVLSHQVNYSGRNAAIVAVHDVTDLHHAEATLRASKARLQGIQRHLARAQRVAGIGSIEHNTHTGEVVGSDELYRILGVDPASFVPTMKNVLTLVHEEDRERVRGVLRAMRDGATPPAMEFRIVRSDGEMRSIRTEAEVTYDESGAAAEMLVILKDITEETAAAAHRRELESQLLRSQKIEALGTLAGGVAHDLNNTLVPVLAMSKLLMRQLPETSRERASVATIFQAGERARDLVRRILAFSRKEEPIRRTIDLAPLLRDSLKLLSASLPKTLRLVEAIEEAPLVSADPGQLDQVVTNLVLNAAHAIGFQPGTITVRLGRAPENALAGEPHAPPRPAIRLSVEDDGCGMDEATLRRIFEPFFTTKAVGEGTGLGLSVVHGIVSEHGGRINVTSRIGNGTRFEIDLPALTEEEADHALAETAIAV